MEALPKINPTLPEPIVLNENAQLWEENRQQIAEAVEYIIMNNEKVTVSQVAKKANLSRPTVYAHLDTIGNKLDDNGEPLSADVKLIMLMQGRVLQKVCNQALQGDAKMAKLFLGRATQPKTVQRITNHYENNRYHTITFKGLTITEKFLQNLPPEMQTNLVTLLKTESENTNRTENAQQ